MIRCHLSRLLGDRKLKIADAVRDTGINRGTLTRLYYENFERIEIDALDRLCRYFGCGLEELLEHVPDPAPAKSAKVDRPEVVVKKAPVAAQATVKRARAK
jgi:putative transcriptional regulator